MKNHLALFLSVALPASFLSLGSPSFAAPAGALETETGKALEAKAKAAIAKGLGYLKEKQKPEGFWTTGDYPGLTALVVQAFILSPDAADRKSEAVARGLEFIRKSAKPDGSLQTRGMSVYNTSICLAALVRNGDVKDRALMDAANRYLIGGQRKGTPDGKVDGGFDYGVESKGKPAADLDNTYFTLEALRLYRDMQKSQDLPVGEQLNWQAAIDFVSRCQQLPETNKASWVSGTPEEKGGFVYKADPESGDGSGGPPRSYGTMTYAGLLSFIYAEVNADDPRVKAARQWVERRYTLEENPGKGAEGLYYYYHLMAKGLTAAGVKELKVPDGRAVNWRAELTGKLLSLQKPDGSWASTNGRFMEKDPNLVTAYCLLALEQLVSGK